MIPLDWTHIVERHIQKQANAGDLDNIARYRDTLVRHLINQGRTVEAQLVAHQTYDYTLKIQQTAVSRNAAVIYLGTIPIQLIELPPKGTTLPEWHIHQPKPENSHPEP